MPTMGHPLNLMTIQCRRIELKVHSQNRLVVLNTEIKLKRRWLYFGSTGNQKGDCVNNRPSSSYKHNSFLIEVYICNNILTDVLRLIVSELSFLGDSLASEKKLSISFMASEFEEVCVQF